MSARADKGGGDFQGIKLLLCENPLPPIQEAIVAARAQLPHGNYYTEPYSAPLRELIAARKALRALRPQLLGRRADEALAEIGLLPNSIAELRSSHVVA